MTRFHTLSIKDIQRETKDCVSVAFDVPERLADEFVFQPGQYLVLKTIINGAEVRRSYSICSSPAEKELRVAIKQIEGGLFSTFANKQLEQGETLEVMPPAGNFGFEKNTEANGQYVAFAAGSGITPIMSIVKSTLEANPDSHFTLFYGNKNQQSVIFNEQLAFLKNQFLNRFSIYHILSKENPGSALFYGRIDEEKCLAYCDKLIDPKAIDAFFLCGPSGMIETVSKCLKNVGVDSEKIHFELFTTSDQKAAPTLPKTGDTKAFAVTIDIRIDNDTFTVHSPSNDGTILDMANDTGLDLPFSCKGGVCCTCRAKLTEGEAVMDVNYALEDDEVDAGYILTCQARPKTQKVAVDFDA
jgi:ring-1,2-phenylacetyl-CoA epoxidase subunit PaaE